jgi:hypothetical protein
MATGERDIRPALRHALPVPVEPRTPRPSLARSTIHADFVSQLLTARSRATTQRRRPPANAAIAAYDAGARIAVRRMPNGYRTTIVV